MIDDRMTRRRRQPPLNGKLPCCGEGTKGKKESTIPFPLSCPGEVPISIAKKPQRKNSHWATAGKRVPVEWVVVGVRNKPCCLQGKANSLAASAWLPASVSQQAAGSSSSSKRTRPHKQHSPTTIYKIPRETQNLNTAAMMMQSRRNEDFRKTAAFFQGG